MVEWWTYRPSDFLMFAPRTYWRLFELHNAAWWPLQPLLLVLLAVWAAWLWRAGRPALRAGAGGLALAWAFVGWFFLLERFAPIHWAMSAGTAAFAVQALLLATLALRADLRVAAAPWARRGGVLLIGAAGLNPLLVLAFGRPWMQAEVAGLAPDPTAVATLGLLLMARATTRPTRAVLAAAWLLAAGWCLLSAATLWTMGSAQGWVPFAAVAAALALRGRPGPP